MYPKKDFSELQQTLSRWRLPSIHERSLFCVGDQPKKPSPFVHRYAHETKYTAARKDTAATEANM
jgi:hypothetical protein